MKTQKKTEFLPQQYISQLNSSIKALDTFSYATYRDNLLYTAFQPIFSLAHKRIVGYEALLRVVGLNNQSISPAEMFRVEAKNVSLTQLDRLCRSLHLRNFSYINDSTNWLFLNISPQIISQGKTHGSFFHNLLSELDFPPHRVVVEIVEHPISDRSALARTVDYYKEMGCLIAIDDFGTGHSNFERIWSLEPEIVKLDQSMVTRAVEQRRIRQLLPEIVDLLHQAGSLVLLEGVETLEQAMIAMECDVDFVQGYYFAKPTTEYKDLSAISPSFESLFKKHKHQSAEQDSLIATIQKRYQLKIREVIQSIQNGSSFNHACQPIIEDDLMIRCYLLSPNGVQVGHTIVCDSYSSNEDARFIPIQSGESADWFRRHYLKNAVSHPEQLQITQPYLSITGAHMCITLSMMFPSESSDQVFCCDLNWY